MLRGLRLSFVITNILMILYLIAMNQRIFVATIVVLTWEQQTTNSGAAVPRFWAHLVFHALQTSDIPMDRAPVLICVLTRPCLLNFSDRPLSTVQPKFIFELHNYHIDINICLWNNKTVRICLFFGSFNVYSKYEYTVQQSWQLAVNDRWPPKRMTAMYVDLKT